MAEADETVAALRPRLAGAEAERTLAKFEDGLATFERSARKAIELSRQETVGGAEDRDGSRTVYTEQVATVFEQLDTFHDQLEEEVTAQAEAGAASADASAAPARRTVLIVLAIAVLAAIGLALLVTRSVTRLVADLGRRSTRPSRPPAPASWAAGSRSSPRRSASWPRAPRAPRPRSPR